MARWLRGVVGSTLLWGAGWLSAGIVLLGGLHLLGMAPARFSWTAVLENAVNFGILGAVAGGGFSALISVIHRGRQIIALRSTSFGLAGGLLAGFFVPAVIVIGRVLTGVTPAPLETLLSGGLWAMILGGITAAGSLKIAQHTAAQFQPVDSNRALQDST